MLFIYKFLLGVGPWTRLVATVVAFVTDWGNTPILGIAKSF